MEIKSLWDAEFALTPSPVDTFAAGIYDAFPPWLHPSYGSHRHEKAEMSAEERRALEV
jgi:hypothetical protein